MGRGESKMTYGIVLLLGIGIGLTLNRFNEWLKRRWDKVELLPVHTRVKKTWGSDGE